MFGLPFIYFEGSLLDFSNCILSLKIAVIFTYSVEPDKMLQKQHFVLICTACECTNLRVIRNMPDFAIRHEKLPSIKS